MDVAEALSFLGVDYQKVISDYVSAHPHETEFSQGKLDELRDSILALAKKEYKARAKLLHPDVGGDTDKMQELNRAMAIALALTVTFGMRVPPPVVMYYHYTYAYSYTTSNTGFSGTSSTNTF